MRCLVLKVTWAALMQVMFLRNPTVKEKRLKVLMFVGASETSVMDL